MYCEGSIANAFVNISEDMSYLAELNRHAGLSPEIVREADIVRSF